MTSYAVTLRSKMFAGSIFFFLIPDILQEYVNTKTLVLWRCDSLHLSFAKCGATLTKCRHHRRRRKKSNLPSKVLNANKNNKSMHFYHCGRKTGLGLSTWMLNLDKLQHQQLSKVPCIARYVKRHRK